MTGLAIAAFVLACIIAGSLFGWHRLSIRRLFFQALELQSLLIRLPLPAEKADSPEKLLAEINLSAQLFSALAGIKVPFALELAVHHIGEEIHFYVAVPRNAVEFTIRQIHGFWPTAQVDPSEDYTIFNPEGAALAAYVKQGETTALPIKTFLEAKLDTFAPIASTFSKLEKVGEGLALQIIVKPAGASTKKSYFASIENLKKGKTVKLGVKKGGEEQTTQIVDEEKLKLIQQKVSKPLYFVNVRLVSSAPTPRRARELLDTLTNSFGQFNSPTGQTLKIVESRNPSKLIRYFIFRIFDGGAAMTLNVDELASMFHLPTSAFEIPKVKSVKAREAAPPATLPAEGVQIGESAFRGERRAVRITDDDRRRHVYLIGQTGTGKSTLMTNMVVDDIRQEKGVAIIDPHGDLIETILGSIPEKRANEAIVFDPGDRERPLGMNMLEYRADKPEEKTFIVNELFNILDKLYDMKTVGGPMFEQYTKNAILLLMEDMAHEPATLMEMPRVFTDPEFRKRKLARITNPVVIDFWEKEATKATGEHSLANMAPYITSKFNNFIANDYVRPIVGQTKSAFNFRKVMDEGKILLVNLSKGKIGDLNAGLLGMVITGKILMAALSRVDAPQEERRDFNLYIDEFQNFTTESIATILSEARKYRLNLVMAHQFIGQLTEKIRDAVFGNVGSAIAFRVGATDAEFLEKQFAPTFNKNDLINIDNFNAYAKLLIKGQTARPFNIRTLPAEQGSAERREMIKGISALTYGRPQREVEMEILQRLRTRVLLRPCAVRHRRFPASSPDVKSGSRLLYFYLSLCVGTSGARLRSPQPHSDRGRRPSCGSVRELSPDARAEYYWCGRMKKDE